jgi:APA family basic amino acid/polyamine antiporter
MSRAPRRLGLWTLTALVVGNIVGSGLFLLPSALAPFGGAAIAGFAFSAAGSIVVALVLSSLAARDPRPGGPQAWTRETFGDGAGFTIAWSYWTAVWTGNAAIAVAFAGYLAATVPWFGESPARASAAAIGAIWLTTATALAGARGAGRAALVLTLAKSLPLVAIVLGAALAGDPTHIAAAPPQPMAWFTAAATCAGIAMWSFVGMESAAVPAADVDDAQRTIPRATVFGVLIAAAITIGAVSAVMLLVPAQSLAGSSAPFADAASAVFGDGAGLVVAATAAIACYGTLNGFAYISGQVVCTAARDGLFPPALAATDGIGVPRTALLVSATLSSALVLANQSGTLAAIFTFAILLSTAATLLPYLACALVHLRVVRDGPRSRVLGTVAMVFCIAALLSTGAQALAWGAVLLLAGFPLWWWRGSRGG